MARKKVTKRSYSLEEKQKAAIHYAVKGSYSQVARSMNIPKDTIIGWSKHWEGWDTLVTQVNTVKKDKHRAMYVRLIEKGQARALKLLPLTKSAKEAMLVACMAQDKVYLADKVEQVGTDNKSIKDAIMGLASTFKQLSDTYKAKDINVVSEQGKGIDDTQPTDS